MDDAAIKAEAMELVDGFSLPLAVGMALYEKVVAFGVAIAANYAPPKKAKRHWSPEVLARVRSDPKWMEQRSRTAAKGRAVIAAKRAAKRTAAV